MMQLEDLQTNGITRNKVTMDLLVLAGRALTEIKFTLEISMFCKLTERCHKLRFDKVRIRLHSTKRDKRGSTPAHLFGSCVVDQRISMSVNSTTVFLWRTHKTTALHCVVLHFSLLGELVLGSHTHTHTHRRQPNFL